MATTDMTKYKNACTKARAKVLGRFPHLSPLILNLPFQIIPDCPTGFVTQGGVVGIGTGFIDKYSNPELAALFIHEGFHVMFDHFGRRGARDPKLWNMAGDVVINETIRRMTRIMTMDIAPDRDMLYPETFNLDFANEGNIPTVDTVYNLLLKEAEKNKSKAGKERGACGTGAGGEATQWEEQIQGEGKAGLPADVKTKLELAAGAIADACKKAGVGSAEMEMWASCVVKKPRFDPVKELRHLIGMVLASNKGKHVEPVWSKMNRRGYEYLPGQQRFTPEVTVIVDTSGSMFGGQDGDNVLTEIAGMLMKLGRIRVITNDTQVTFDGYISSVPEFKTRAKGGGGTELTPAFQAAEKNNKAAIVVLTDGCLGRPTSPLVEDAVWLLTSKGYKADWMKRVVQLDR